MSCCLYRIAALPAKTPEESNAHVSMLASVIKDNQLFCTSLDSSTWDAVPEDRRSNARPVPGAAFQGLPDTCALAILHSPYVLQKGDQTSYYDFLKNSTESSGLTCTVVFVSSGRLELGPKRVDLGESVRYLLPIPDTTKSLLNVSEDERRSRWSALVRFCLNKDRLDRWFGDRFWLDAVGDDAILRMVFPVPAPAREDLRLILAGWLVVNAERLANLNADMFETLRSLGAVDGEPGKWHGTFAAARFQFSTDGFPLRETLLEGIGASGISAFRSELANELDDAELSNYNSLRTLLKEVEEGKEPTTLLAASAYAELARL